MTTKIDCQDQLKESKIKKFFKQHYKTMIFFLLVFIMVVFGSIILNKYFNFGFSNTNGKSFGELGGYLSFFVTIIAIFYAYRSFKNQSYQLDIQKKEAAKQRFQDIFFQLLDLQNNIVDKIEHEIYDSNDKEKVKTYTSRSYFKKVYQDLMNNYLQLEKDQTDASIDDLLERSMGKLDSQHKDNLPHYYRNLYQIFTWVESNEEKLEGNEQEEYINFIRAQLSYYELYLLYFNARYIGKSEYFFTMLNDKYNLFYKYHKQDSPNIINSFLHDVLNYKKKLEGKDNSNGNNGMNDD